MSAHTIVFRLVGPSGTEFDSRPYNVTGPSKNAALSRAWDMAEFEYRDFHVWCPLDIDGARCDDEADWDALREQGDEEIADAFAFWEEKTTADARLMAAAPDLLAACMEVAAGYSTRGSEMARAAIAKATGEQP